MSNNNRSLTKQASHRRRWQRSAFTFSLGILAACSGSNNGGTTADGGGGDGGSGGGDGGSGVKISVTAARGGTGNGRVASQPSGIDCGATCTASFAQGGMLTLSAGAAVGSGGGAFSGWTGACAGQGPVCKLTPNADVSTTANFDAQFCTADSLCWEAPLPFGFQINDVYALTATDVWAVGNGGSIVHYDGTTWNRSPSGVTQDLFGVFARSPTDVWVAAGGTATDNRTMLRYNGSTWAKSNILPAIVAPEQTTSVWGDKTTNLFVTVNAATVYQSTNNGTTWTPFNNVGRAGFAHLFGVTGLNANDVWTWGDDITLYHWNGGGWAQDYRGSFTIAAVPAGLSMVSGTSSWMIHSTGNLFRNTSGGVGSPGTNQGFYGAAGGAAKAVVPGSMTTINALWAADDTHVLTSGRAGIIYSYNGTAFTTNQSNTPEVYAFNKIHGTAATDAWAVGQRGVISHWDGTTAAAAKRFNVFTGDVLGVWGSSKSDVWFVTNKTSVVHYDGTGYQETTGVITGPGADLKGIGGSSPTDVWAVGTINSKAAIQHFDGKAWTPSTIDPLFNDNTATRVWASGPQDAWATGTTYYNLLHWTGSSWSQTASPVTKAAPSALWGSGASDVWVADIAQPANLFHYDGTSWAPDNKIAIQLGATGKLYSLGGSSATNVWAGGDAAVYYWNGANWQTFAVPATPSRKQIVSITATSATDVWAIDAAGSIFHYTGAASGGKFVAVDSSIGSSTVGSAQSPGITPFYSWAADANNVWFGGAGILSYRK